MSNIVIDNITIDRLHSIEKEREQTMHDKNFIQWCKDMRIGCRVEVKDYRAIELQQQYEHNYPNWIKRMF
jgi:hypothetical protein